MTSSYFKGSGGSKFNEKVEFVIVNLNRKINFKPYWFWSSYSEWKNGNFWIECLLAIKINRNLNFENDNWSKEKQIPDVFWKYVGLFFLYRHSPISAVWIYAIFDLPCFIILSYFPLPVFFWCPHINRVNRGMPVFWHIFYTHCESLPCLLKPFCFIALLIIVHGGRG